MPARVTSTVKSRYLLNDVQVYEVRWEKSCLYKGKQSLHSCFPINNALPLGGLSYTQEHNEKM